MEDTTQMMMYHVMHLYGQRSIELLRELHIHPGQAGLLWALSRGGGEREGMSQKELAKVIGVRPPSITVMLKKLESEEYIKKCQDENDQRIMRIFLTEKGKNTATLMGDILKDLEAEAFRNMSEQEIILFHKLLAQLRSNLREKTRKED